MRKPILDSLPRRPQAGPRRVLDAAWRGSFEDRSHRRRATGPRGGEGDAQRLSREGGPGDDRHRGQHAFRGGGSSTHRGGARPPPSQEYLGREIDNIIAAFNEIKGELLAGVPPAMSRATIENYNRLILDRLELEEGVVAGRISTHPVGVGGYAGAPRQDCEFLLDRLSQWLNGPDFAARSPQWTLPMAIAKAIVAHLYIAWIHPFGDGNGRTARLMELRMLLEAGVPTAATHLLSNHYNQTRNEYYRQLRLSSRNGGDALPFAMYALQGFVDGLRDQLRTIRKQQFADRWEQYVYQQFLAPYAQSQSRRDVFNKTGKTLTRDINAIVEVGLVRRHGRSYVPNKRVIEAFLPVTAETHDP